jgi:hypothetical protein
VADADCAFQISHAARFPAPDPLAERMLAMLKPLDLTGYKPSPELLETLIRSNELAIMNLSGVNDDWARRAIATMRQEIARFRARLEGEMLIRITGENPPFVAGVVFGDDERVVKVAPIVKWAKGLDHDQLRAEIRKRGLKAAYVKTLTAQEIEAS